MILSTPSYSEWLHLELELILDLDLELGEELVVAPVSPFRDK